jgi:hypothetical protein
MLWHSAHHIIIHQPAACRPAPAGLASLAAQKSTGHNPTAWHRTPAAGPALQHPERLHFSGFKGRELCCACAPHQTVRTKDGWECTVQHSVIGRLHCMSRVARTNWPALQCIKGPACHPVHLGEMPPCRLHIASSLPQAPRLPEPSTWPLASQLLHGDGVAYVIIRAADVRRRAGHYFEPAGAAGKGCVRAGRSQLLHSSGGKRQHLGCRHHRAAADCWLAPAGGSKHEHEQAGCPGQQRRKRRPATAQPPAGCPAHQPAHAGQLACRCRACSAC